MSTSVLELHPGDDFIELYKVLKIEGWVGSGSEAKMLIAEGEVLVNHEVETRKRRKLVPGDNVIFGEEAVLIQASGKPAPQVDEASKPAKPKRRPSVKF
ncbi:RNA-binding S4 domain-containing protein [Halomonas denitrificans]|nr:RNA-binding S4 domain-containing protein [Halomonas denitrificans]MBY6096428.1 RNA-binding S4 domain-containing protein [Ferrimonas balearica]